jgi:branched-chain amino acid transport system ATP-binding protein
MSADGAATAVGGAVASASNAATAATLPAVPALELRGVHAGYGRIEILHGLDLVVPAGTVFALLGPNGAGKTTTLKVCDGRLPATSGCVHVAGTHVNGAATDQLTRAGVCAIPEGRGVFPNLTVAENLRIMTHALGGLKFADVEAKAYAQFPILAERRNQLSGTMSGGQQQMLAMCRALVTDPALLLVDELSMGLAPLIVEELYQVLADLAADGVAILLVEQFPKTALAIADYGAILVGGQILQIGQPQDLGDELSAAYLGGTT